MRKGEHLQLRAFTSSTYWEVAFSKAKNGLLQWEEDPEECSAVLFSKLPQHSSSQCEKIPWWKLKKDEGGRAVCSLYIPESFS